MSSQQKRLKRASLISQIDAINDKCKICFVHTGSAHERNKKMKAFCTQCENFSAIKALGVKLLNLENEKKFTDGEIFYIMNHLEALGVQRGLLQVASRLGRDVWEVEAQYYMEKEKSTRNMAV